MINFRHLLDNIYINIAGVLAVFLAPFADAIGENNVFLTLAIFLLFIFLFGVFNEYNKNKKLKVDIIHIPIVIQVDEGPDKKYVMNSLISKIENDNSLNNYEFDLRKYFGISVENLIFDYKGSIYDFDHLMNFMRIIKYSISNIEKQLNGRAKFHIAYYKKPSIGFMVGTLFRTESVVIYQNNDYENRFIPISDIKSRKYKEQVDVFTRYTITEDINDEESKVLIYLESASHNIAINNEEFKKYKNKIKIKLNGNGTIPYDEDWAEYSAEIYSKLNELQTKYKEITIAHSMPEAIAIILGMAIENYWNINLLQYDNNQYKFILNMQKIKYYS